MTPAHAGTAAGSGTSFRRRAARAIADANLQAALDLATERLATGRARAMEALPGAEGLRERARRVRAHTIAHLDRYLAEFADRAAAAGAEVHWAPTAADAVRAVCRIARANDVRLAVKSKSMVTEEIALNAGLEAAGVNVVETDLGEFVVQLAQDRPSHIIAPIIHRTAGDVAGLFRSALGATDEDVADIGRMTAFARRTLRERFLAADMGVSGANFAVAGTGTLAVVTNEGNGRLVTTAPRLHVAVVGIERIVPTPGDLSLMLQLLARSATGQALTVYTNLMTGPRRAGPDDSRESDGPDELHIVLVDNGRSRILAGELAEILYCIRCGACLNICPVYRSAGGHAYGGVYPGPIGSVFSPALYGITDWTDLPQASTLCGACRDVCPVGIDIPRLLLALRADAGSRAASPPWLRFALARYAALATSPARFRFAGRVARAAAWPLARGGWLRWLPGPLRGWTAHRDFPAPARRSFTDQWKQRGGS
jgi:L-lactate dehydrogenase complex protein LldF